jgi:type IV secretion system protein VirB10
MARRSIRRQSGANPGENPPPDEGEAKVVDLATRQVIPAVARRSGRDWSEVYAGIAVVAVLGAVTLWMVYWEPQPRSSSNPVVDNPPGIEAGRLVLPELPLLPDAAGQATLPSGSPGEAPVAGELSTPDLAPVLAQPPGSEETDLSAEEPAEPANPHSSPTVVFDAGNGDTNAIMVPDGLATRQGAPRPARPRAGATGSRSTLTKGTLIPAILETPIDAARPGLVRAIVSSDVRSSDGSQVLVARSSRLIGEYRSEGSGAQKRATVIWTRLTRPNGASQDLPASGQGALSSVIAGLAATAGQSGRVRQGEPVRVMTLRDLELTQGQ